jgi:hypothetical protein
MADTPPKPKRRRWRWLAAGMVLVIGLGVWFQDRKSETVRRAMGLRVGMPISEVDRLMGEPYMRGTTPDGNLMTVYGTTYEQIDNSCRRRLCTLLERFGLPGMQVLKPLPVTVCFDRDQRIAWFHRGREYVGVDVAHQHSAPPGSN